MNDSAISTFASRPTFPQPKLTKELKTIKNDILILDFVTLQNVLQEEDIVCDT